MRLRLCLTLWSRLQDSAGPVYATESEKRRRATLQRESSKSAPSSPHLQLASPPSPRPSHNSGAAAARRYRGHSSETADVLLQGTAFAVVTVTTNVAAMLHGQNRRCRAAAPAQGGFILCVPASLTGHLSSGYLRSNGGGGLPHCETWDGAMSVAEHELLAALQARQSRELSTLVRPYLIVIPHCCCIHPSGS